MKTPLLIFEPEKGAVYDFISLVIQSLKFSHISSAYVEMGVQPDEIITASYNRLRSVVVKNENALLKLMFSCGENGLTLFSSFHDFLLKSNTIDELIDKIVDYDVDSYFVKTLSFFDIDHKFSYNFYSRIIGDRELLMEYLNALKMTPEKRLAFLNFIELPHLMLKELKKSLLAIKKELDIEYKILMKYRTSFYEKLKNELKLDDAEAFHQRFCLSKSTFRDTAYEEIQISAVLYIPFAIQFIGDNRRLNTYFGVDWDKQLNTGENSINDISFIFKAFTDITRIKALHLIKEKGSVNYSQLSKDLDVPLSSMSHHIDILVESGIIARRNKGKRTFFSLNESGIQNAISVLSEFR